MSPTLRSAAGSDVGRRRPINQDSAVTSPRLLAVADGMGGHAHGEVASSVAVSALLDLDARLRGVDLADVDLLAVLHEAIDAAGARLTELGAAGAGAARHRHHRRRLPRRRLADRGAAHR